MKKTTFYFFATVCAIMFTAFGVKAQCSGPAPTITVSGPSAIICANTSVTLSASGAATYTWNSGANTSAIIVSPTASTNYTVTGTSAQGCTATAVCMVTVTPNPNLHIYVTPVLLPVNAVPNHSMACLNSTATLTAYGAASYTWNGGVPAQTSTAVISSSIVYTVSGANSIGCTSTQTIGVDPVSGPLTINSPAEACRGVFYTLEVIPNTYYPSVHWSTGSSQYIAVINQSSTTTYTLYDLTCIQQQTITVNSSPALQVNSAPNPSVCAYEPLTLTASGANTYTWNGFDNNSSITITPSVSTSFTVRSNGGISGSCLDSAVISLYVYPPPSLLPRNLPA